MDVIISDVDGTVFDVTERIKKSLLDVGLKPGSDPIATADNLVRPHRGRFLDVFLSNRYIDLDTPVPAIIETLARLQAETDLPLVFLTGRPNNLRRPTEKALEETGLRIVGIHVRSQRERFKRTTEFKVDLVRRKQLMPVHIFDDDPEILAAFAEAFPAAHLHLVRGSQTTPWPD